MLSGWLSFECRKLVQDGVGMFTTSKPVNGEEESRRSRCSSECTLNTNTHTQLALVRRKFLRAKAVCVCKRAAIYLCALGVCVFLLNIGFEVVNFLNAVHTSTNYLH